MVLAPDIIVDFASYPSLKDRFNRWADANDICDSLSPTVMPYLAIGLKKPEIQEGVWRRFFRDNRLYVGQKTIGRWWVFDGRSGGHYENKEFERTEDEYLNGLTWALNRAATIYEKKSK